MNLGGRSLVPPLSLARDYSDVMLMRMATKEISRRRRGEKGVKEGEKRDGGWWVAVAILIPYSLFRVAS